MANRMKVALAWITLLIVGGIFATALIMAAATNPVAYFFGLGIAVIVLIFAGGWALVFLLEEYR